MTFTLLDIHINKRSTSYIMILEINGWYLFNIDWAWRTKHIIWLTIFGIKII